MKKKMTYIIVFVVTTMLTFGGYDASARHTSEPQTCTCSVRLSYAKPDVQFKQGTLTVTPRINLDIRTKGKSTLPGWQLQADYTGSVAFSSRDIQAPDKVMFSGNKQIAGGQCGNNRYSYSGIRFDDVAVSSVTPSIVGDDEELKGKVSLNTIISGCDQDKENRGFEFTVQEFGNLKVKSWRSL